MMEDISDRIGQAPGGAYFIVQEGEPEYEMVKASIERRTRKDAFLASVRGILWGQVALTDPIIKQIEVLYDATFRE